MSSSPPPTGAQRILDVGGWFKPNPRATHVVDLMPWETRGAKLNLAPLPGEQFSRDTWFQTDFLDPDLRLPFEDSSFDLVLCGHTIEDLTAPEPLLREFQRVAVASSIECPSRLTEQTVGLRDRATSEAGHPHHHWIVEVADDTLCLFAKSDSDLRRDATTVPLVFRERLTRGNPAPNFVTYCWSGKLKWRFVAGVECEQRARQFVAGLNIPRADRVRDRLLRCARRLRNHARGRSREDFSWWTDIREVSRPYSRIKI